MDLMDFEVDVAIEVRPSQILNRQSKVNTKFHYT
jgi:hypothetical protein